MLPKVGLEKMAIWKAHDSIIILSLIMFLTYPNTSLYAQILLNVSSLISVCFLNAMASDISFLVSASIYFIVSPTEVRPKLLHI